MARTDQWEQSRHFQATPDLPSLIDVTAEMVAHLEAMLGGLLLPATG